MKKEIVEVTKDGAGLRFLGADMKALPMADKGDVITVLGGAYAKSLVESGYVRAVVVDAAVPKPEPDNEPAPQPVTAVPGLGKATAKKLAAIGIKTVADMAEADITAVAAQTDLSESKLIEYQAAAIELLNPESAE